MKKRTSSIFFGICFMAALLFEAYCLARLRSNLYTMLGVGLLVLVTGYQFMDSLRNSIMHSSENLKNYVDRIIHEEIKKWNDRYDELSNIQKATYGLAKKNTLKVNELLSAIVDRLETLEKVNNKEWNRVIELQKRSMENQKKALSLEVRYNKENTKQVLEVLQKEGIEKNLEEKLKKVIELLEINNELIKEHNIAPEPSGSKEEIPSEPEAFQISEELEEQPSDEIIDQPNINVEPLYEDPNKNLTADEIAALFASIGK